MTEYCHALGVPAVGDVCGPYREATRQVTVIGLVPHDGLTYVAYTAPDQRPELQVHSWFNHNNPWRVAR